ncbi:MAG: restriction endonuclease subunit S [Oscillospiraceae bacterium]|jgi:type I restriction enzyme S subunit|nr:restriction endonuclease subunit S [Oscillospiraceae bacterium]
MIYNETKYNRKWDTRKLRNLGDFSRGRSTHRPRNDELLYLGGGYPFVQTGDIKSANLFIENHTQEYNKTGFSQSKLWDKGTLCITIAANIAETAILSYPMCFPDSIVGFKAYPTETSALFMHYVFAFIRLSIQQSVNGSIQDNINIDYLENLDFKIPNKKIQDRIVSVLYALDNKISLNNRINAELEKTARVVYEYMFLRGKTLNTHFLSKKLSFQRGVEPGRIAYSETKTETNNIPFIRVRDLGQSPALFISKENAKNTYCKPNDVLVAFDGSVGKMSIAMEGAYSTGIRKIKAKDSDYSDALIYFIFSSEEIQETIKKYAVGSNILHSASSIEHLTFPWQKEKVEIFNEKVEPMYKMIVKNILENKALTEQRDFLLPLLMNGQVTVKGGEE